MTIPQDRSSISTNLSQAQIQKVLLALESGAAKEIPRSGWIFAESCRWRVEFDGAEYEIYEFAEVVKEVTLCSGPHSLVLTIREELGGEHEEALGAHGYDSAKNLHARMKALGSLISAAR